VWGQAYNGLPDNEWPDHQRIHQYNGDALNEALGKGLYYRTFGTVQLHVDVDIEDGAVVPGNPVKPYSSYSLTTISGGGYATCPTNINDAYLGDGSGKVGQVVGTLGGTYGCFNEPGSQGALWDNGSTTLVSCGTPPFQPTGINNQGQVVGYDYTNQSYEWPSCTPIPCGGSGATATGINDAGWVSGAGGGGGTFLYKPDGTCITYNDLDSGSLDGLGRIGAQGKRGAPVLLDFQADSTPAVTAMDTTVGIPFGLSNDGVVAGGERGGGSGTGVLLYGGNWYPAGSFTDDLLTYEVGSGGRLAGVNDAGQVAGWYYDSSGNYIGFVLSPNF
jgi:hypothetical protein